MATVQEILGRLNQLEPSQLEGFDGSVILFDLTGETGGKWTVSIIETT